MAKAAANYVPLTCLQKAILIPGSSILCLLNPYRDDMVAALGELTGNSALNKIFLKMQSNETGRLILKEKPHITSQSMNFPKLELLGKNTFGRAYFDFNQKRTNRFINKNICLHCLAESFTIHISKLYSFSKLPDSRLLPKFVENPDLAFVVKRYRQVHDIWHVVFDAPTNIYGELGLKLFEFLKLGLPMTGLGALSAPLSLSWEQQKRFYLNALPWAIYCAGQTGDLMSVYYEKCFEEDFGEFKKRLGVVDFPK